MVKLGKIRVQRSTKAPPSAKTPTTLLMVGSTVPKAAARIANQADSTRCHWSVMAAAICSALPMPWVLPRALILLARPLVLLIKSLIIETASSEPNAFFSSSLPATVRVSP
ncbi:hypothetical protein D3C79_938770 [compost metagenome]